MILLNQLSPISWMIIIRGENSQLSHIQHDANI